VIRSGFWIAPAVTLGIRKCVADAAEPGKMAVPNRVDRDVEGGPQAQPAQYRKGNLVIIGVPIVKCYSHCSARNWLLTIHVAKDVVHGHWSEFLSNQLHLLSKDAPTVHDVGVDRIAVMERVLLDRMVSKNGNAGLAEHCDGRQDAAPE
jgi:hypothetical protein